MLARVIAVSLSLYIVALHCSMAGVEIFGWMSVVLAIIVLIRQKSAPPFDLVSKLWGALVVSILISTLLAKPEYRNWDHFGFMRWIFIGLAWQVLLPSQLGSPKNFAKGIKIWHCALILTSLYAFLQAFFGIDLLRMHKKDFLVPVVSMWRATGPYTISITFASIVGMSSAAAWAWMAFGPKNDRKLAFVAALCGSVATVLSLSRATSIAIVLVVLLIVLWAWRKWFPLVFVGIAGAAVITWFQFTGFRGRFQGLENLSQDHSVVLRMGLWKSYWTIFAENPFFGVGLFSPQKYLPELYARFGVTENFFSHAHSNILQWLAGGGAIAAILYLTISFLLIGKSWCLFRKGSDERFRALGAGLLMAQLVFHFDGLIECNFFDGEVNHLIVWVWGLTLAAIALDKKKWAV